MLDGGVESWIDIGSRYKLAVNKGYKVDREGRCFGPRGKILQPMIKKNGNTPYYTIAISAVGGAYKLKVHRLQAYQKFGDKIFEPGIQVRHLDNNSLNNSFDNLELGTAKQNFDDLTEDMKSSMSQRRHSLGPYLRVDICKKRLDGISISDLAKEYNVSEGTIRKICQGKINGVDNDVNVEEVLKQNRYLIFILDKIEALALKTQFSSVSVDWEVIESNESTPHLVPIITMTK